jgi:tRNA-specific 2-thiouridylase
MSGGVDSSVCAWLLKEQGYEVIGATMELWQEGGSGMESAAVSDARRVAEVLDIPFHAVDLRDRFHEEVVRRFTGEYLQGRTPNPCIFCNPQLKWGAFLERCRELGAEYIATGHYARVEQLENGRYAIRNSAAAAKDQTYVLYRLTQDQLAHVQFPLGDQDKHTTREIAAESGFRNAEKKDSQDICFVPDGDYAGFILRYSGRDCPAGDFVDAEGNVLGRHKGIIHYTLGQRRGLGIPAAHRCYVTKIDPESNTVTLGTNEDLMKTTLYARRINLITTDRIKKPLRCSAKIRYRHKEQPCTVTQPEDDLLRVEFDQPQRAITPGQSVVLYDGDIVIGGGIIS